MMKRRDGSSGQKLKKAPSPEDDEYHFEGMQGLYKKYSNKKRLVTKLTGCAQGEWTFEKVADLEINCMHCTSPKITATDCQKAVANLIDCSGSQSDFFDVESTKITQQRCHEACVCLSGVYKG